MLLALLSLMDVVAAPAGPTPAIGTVTVTSNNSGTCSGLSVGTPASVKIAWTITNPNNTLYYTNVMQDGALLSGGINNATLQYIKTVSGQVESGANATRYNWQFRVDVVRRSDSVVVSSVNAASVWATLYGDCSGNH